MEKTNLCRNMAIAAISVLTAGSVVFTSCETFDDTALQGSIDDLNSRVEKLEDDIAQLQSEVETISDMVSGGKIISSIVPSADKTEYTISFVGSDEKFVVTAGTGNPVVTVIEDNGTYYWALVKDGDASEITDNNGDRVPVNYTESAEVKLQINESTGDLEISIDGGSWTPSGVNVNEFGDPQITLIEKGGKYYWGKYDENGNKVSVVEGKDVPVEVEIPDPVIPQFKVEGGKLMYSTDNGSSWKETGITAETGGISVISDVDLESKPGYAVFTLNGGTKLEILIESELYCEFLSGKTWFEDAQTKRLMLYATGYKKYELSAPLGWTAEFDGSAVTVTAPDSEWDENFSRSGEIVLRLYNDKKEVVMDKVSVQMDGMPIFELKTGLADDKSINIVVNAQWATEFCLGVMPAKEFTAEAAAEQANSGDCTIAYDDDGWEGNDCYLPFKNYIADPVTAAPYVIWIVEAPYMDPVSPDDIQTYVYNYGLTVEASVTDIAFNDAVITVTPGESTEYYAGIMSSEEFEYGAQTITMMIGYGQYTVHSGVFTGKLSELNQEDEQGMMDYAFNYTIVPGAAYTLWTVIKNDSGTYTTDDIQVTEFTLDDVQEGGSAKITFGAPTVVDYTSIEIPFTRPDNAYAVYIMFVSDADFESTYGSSEAAVKETLLEGNAWYTDVYAEENLLPGTSGKFYAVTIDNEGYVGPLVSYAATSKAVVKNSTITIEAGTHTLSGSTISIPLTITGENAKSIVYYNFTGYDYKYHNNIEEVVNNVALDYQTATNFFTVVDIADLEPDNTLVIENPTPYSDAEYLFVVFAIDEDGLVTESYDSIEYVVTAASL